MISDQTDNPQGCSDKCLFAVDESEKFSDNLWVELGKYFYNLVTVHNPIKKSYIHLVLYGILNEIL